MTAVSRSTWNERNAHNGLGWTILCDRSHRSLLINNWIRAKYGYELEDEWGGKSKRKNSAESTKLRKENRELHEKLDQMQDRMIVLEKIVTDRGYSLSEEIEGLRTTDNAKEAK